MGFNGSNVNLYKAALNKVSESPMAVEVESIERVSSSDDGLLKTGQLNPTENRKRYNFSLEPSSKEKLDMLARDAGYAKTSAFLNDLVKMLYDENLKR